MKKLYYLSFLFVLIACKKPKIKNVNKDNTVIEKEVKSIELRKFSNNDKLFLNFFKGMNKHEFKGALRKNIGQSKLYFKKRKKSIYLSILIDEKDLLELTNKTIDNFNIKNDPFQDSELLYRFSTKTDSYFATVIPKFDDNLEISNIILKIPKYYLSGNRSKKEIKKIFNLSKLISSEIHQMYYNKYGKPLVKRGIEIESFNIMIKTVGLSLNNEDKNFFYNDYYYFDEKNNLSIKIFQNCCSEFNTTIIYSLYEDYFLSKKKEKKDKTIQDKNRSQMLQSTKEDL